MIRQQSRGLASGCINLCFLAVPLVSGWTLYEPLASWREPGTIHVATTGSDLRQGDSPETAFATIQRALDCAIPGDRILIAPGTYYERLHVRRGGSDQSPLALAAVEPGTVVITGADPHGVPSEWTWHDEGAGIYSTAISHPVYRLDIAEETCFRIPWGGLTALRKLIDKPGAWSAFCTENDRLYVFLKNGKHPLHSPLRTHRPAPAPREWGEFKSATVWVEADHVRLENLRIEDGIGAAVAVWNAGDVELRDCAFSGSTIGVRCVEGIKPPRDIRLIRCLYHNYPQYHWRRDWLTWAEVYASYSSSTLIASNTAPLSVEQCVVIHGGDALRISPQQKWNSSMARIERNFLALCTDDAIEFDGDGCGVNVANNLVFETHQNLSFSPLEHGPVTVDENVFAHLPDGINGSQVKFIANREGDRIQNITVRGNVFVGNWLDWWNEAPRENIQFLGNRFFVQQQTDPPWPTGVTASADQVQLSEVDLPPEKILREWYQTADGPQWARTVLENHPGPSWWLAEQHPATRDAFRWRNQLRESLFDEVPADSDCSRP